jgi:hypothetical protein
MSEPPTNPSSNTPNRTVAADRPATFASGSGTSRMRDALYATLLVGFTFGLLWFVSGQLVAPWASEP